MVIGGAFSANAMADSGVLWILNPPDFYVGAGVGRSIVTETQLDQLASYYHVLDGNPVGWKGYIGVLPIPFSGVEAEYVDFGRANVRPGPLQILPEGFTE